MANATRKLKEAYQAEIYRLQQTIKKMENGEFTAHRQDADTGEMEDRTAQEIADCKDTISLLQLLVDEIELNREKVPEFF